MKHRVQNLILSDRDDVGVFIVLSRCYLLEENLNVIQSQSNISADRRSSIERYSVLDDDECVGEVAILAVIATSA